MDSAFLTVQEAAIRTSIHPRTIYRWITDGKLPAFGFGKAIRVRLSDIMPPFVTVRQRAPDNRNAKLRSDTLVSDSRVGLPEFPAPTIGPDKAQEHEAAPGAAPHHDTVE